MIGRSIVQLEAYCIKHNKHIVVGKGTHKGFMSNKIHAYDYKEREEE